jgi:hypothetical protein
MGNIQIKDLHDDSKADLHTKDLDGDNEALVHTKDINDDKKGDLHIKNVKVVDQGKRIFDVVGTNMFIPAQNATIKCSDAAIVFYRAFGRILGYCILHQEKIANHAMVGCLYDKCHKFTLLFALYFN